MCTFELECLNSRRCVSFFNPISIFIADVRKQSMLLTQEPFKKGYAFEKALTPDVCLHIKKVPVTHTFECKSSVIGYVSLKWNVMKRYMLIYC